MTADDLWEKHKRASTIYNLDVITHKDFLAALSERDAYVKKECVRVCNKESKRLSEIGFYNEANSCDTCAAAIEKLEIK